MELTDVMEYDDLRSIFLQQGYEIHVTPSVKPEPAHMKEIITCCGARFLPKMPSARKVTACTHTHIHTRIY